MKWCDRPELIVPTLVIVDVNNGRCQQKNVIYQVAFKVGSEHEKVYLGAT